MASESSAPRYDLLSAAPALLAAAMALSSEHELEQVLSRVVAEARRIIGTRYAALALYGPDGEMSRFVQEGLAPQQAAAIGSCPEGRGLLAVVQTSDGALRVSDMSTDPRAGGFPTGHPPMQQLLGAPVATGRGRHGSLYLCDRTDGSAFREADARTVEVLAQLAAAAIESVLLISAERDRVKTQTEAALAEARAADREELLGQVIAAQEAERARVARDLHDEIGQALTSVLLGLHLMEQGSPADRDTDSGRSARLVEVRSLVADALERVRSLAFQLRPTVLDDIGLVPALERLVDDLRGRSQLEVDLTVRGLDDPVRLSGDIETVVYRIVQEALTNVLRHAAASNASVLVVLDAGRVRAVIEDDGSGFDASAHAVSLGLAGMRERASLAGGLLRIESTVGAGTTVMVEVPVDVG